jgi:hypothetical protein
MPDLKDDKCYAENCVAKIIELKGMENQQLAD